MKAAPEPTDPFVGEIGLGARLREEREKANISIERMALLLLLDRKTVNALESDSFEELPAPTFVRGYLRAYARVLGVAPGPILDRYDRYGFGPPSLAPGISTAPPQPQIQVSDTVMRLSTWAVAAVLLVLAGLWWNSQEIDVLDTGGDLVGRFLGAASDESSPAGQADAGDPDAGEPPGDSATGPDGGGGSSGGARFPGPSSAAAVAPGVGARSGVDGAAGPLPFPRDAGSAGPEAEAASDVAADVEPEAAPGPEAVRVAEGGGPAAGTESAAASEAGATSGAGGVGDLPASEPEGAGREEATTGPDRESPPAEAPGAGVATLATGTDPTPAGADAASSGAPRAGQSALVLEFVHESWVEVYDRDRTRLFFGLVAPGRVLDFSGARPFDVLLGFGEDVRVSLDGEVFDHAPYMRHGVAQFRIGEASARDPDSARSGGSADPAGPTEPADSADTTGSTGPSESVDSPGATGSAGSTTGDG